MSLSFCLSLGFFPSLSRGALPRQDRLISTAGSGVGLGYGEKGALSLWRWRKRRVGRSVVTTMAKKEEKPESSTPKWKIGLGLLAVVGALLTPMILPLLDQQAGLSDAEIARRLNQVPVFSVTDNTGKPFLNETGEERIGYFFLDPSDAENFLGKVQTAVGGGSDAKVFPISLDEAYKFVRRRDGGDTFQFFAKDLELREAKTILGQDFQGSVPLFFIDGLAFSAADGSTTIPLFFNKEDLDATVKKLKAENPGIAAQVPDKYAVIDLGSALDELRSGKNEMLKKVVFYPAAESLDYMKSIGIGSAR